MEWFISYFKYFWQFINYLVHTNPALIGLSELILHITSSIDEKFTHYTCWGKSNITNHVEIKMITFHLENLNFRKGSALIILKRQHYINSNAMNTFGWRYWRIDWHLNWNPMDLIGWEIKALCFFNFLSEPHLFM